MSDPADHDWDTCLPGVGIGPIRFGFTADQVIGVAGPPQSSETEDICGLLTQRFHYPSLGLIVEFDLGEVGKVEEVPRVTGLRTTRPGAVLIGRHVIGRGEDELVATLGAPGDRYALEGTGFLQLEFLAHQEGTATLVFYSGGTGSEEVCLSAAFDDAGEEYVFPDGEGARTV